MTMSGEASARKMRTREPDVALRAAIAESLEHPAAIEVEWHGRTLRLSGAILEGEVDKLIERVSRIRGVERIENRIDVIYGEGVAKKNAANRLDYLPETQRGEWPAQVRGAVAVGAFILTILGIGLKPRLRNIFGLFGLLTGIRVLANRDITHMVGSVVTPTLRLRRRITVCAPIDEVFEFWSRVENYPKFMSYIEKVEMNEQGNIVWDAKGPGRFPLRWETELNQSAPNYIQSWQSVSGSIIQTEGWVKLEAAPGDTTRVEVDMNFSPPAGVFGYAVANLLGFDPKKKIDQDLQVMKTLIERSFFRRNPKKVDEFYF